MKSSESRSVRAAAAAELVCPPITEVCALKLVAPDMTEIYPYLGYPRGNGPGASIAGLVKRLVRESVSCLEPRGTFSIYPVTERKKRSLTVGEVTIRGNIAEYMEHADRVAVFIVTIGENISRCTTSTRQGGDALAAWVIDALGSWAAEAAADALMERIQRHLRKDEALTLRYSPGYCGMEMSQQLKLFRLVDAGSVGVKLLPSLLMHPLKSISGLAGVGPKEAISTFRSACDRCPQNGCHMRR